MGKKARKTRWRTLAIDNGDHSDSEESHTTGDGVHLKPQTHSVTTNGDTAGTRLPPREGATTYAPYYTGQHYHRDYRTAYRSTGSTSSSSYHRSYRTSSRYGYQPYGGAAGHHHHSHHHHNHHQQMATAATTITSNGNAASDSKITFNEDEYTRITTPRQDVLFKKGYLSKPKTYQTQTSTGASTVSTGNSTGNGTPDHQSADGTEGTDLEYESQFVFPNGFVDQNGIYYINSFEPYHQVVVYNPALCYPEYIDAPRSKRLSTGSLTESTSPHNEETSQELSHSGGETTVSYTEYNGSGGVLPPIVYPAGYFYSNGGDATVAEALTTHGGEPRKIKKRRRRKLSKPAQQQQQHSQQHTPTSSDDECDESEEMVSEIENRIIQGTHRPPAVDTPSPPPMPTTPPSEEIEADKEEVEEAVQEAKMADTTPPPPVTTPPPPPPANKNVLKADAKEFVPRYAFATPHPHHHPAAHFLIPLPPPPPPAFLHPHPNRPPAPPVISATPPVVEEAPAVVEAPATKEVIEQLPNNNNIDIAKIVSKLEEAAKEQRAAKPPPAHHQHQQRQRRTFGRAMPIDALKTHSSPSPQSRTPTKNYAQMLSKKSHPPSPLRGAQVTKTTVASQTVSPHKQQPQQHAAKMASPRPAAVLPQQPNQWIAVHSRKKRKNNGKESKEASEWDDADEAPPVAEDGFESYDVSKLEDVVVVVEVAVAVVEPVAHDNKTQHVPEDTPPPSVVESEVAIAAEVPAEDTSEQQPAPIEVKVAEEEEFDKLIRTLEALEAKTPAAGKKQRPPKVVGKRVMVTDVVATPPPPPLALLKKPIKVEKVKINKVKLDETEPPPVVEVAAIEPLPALDDGTPEKKRKKKRKPVKKSTSLSNSDTPATMPTTPIATGSSQPEQQQPSPALDASATYDFLLADALAVEEERTNLEVSVELDKIIQRGMFMSLEEKIRSMHITAAAPHDAGDGFFKSMATALFAKAAAPRPLEDDLTSVLTNTTNIFKAKRTLCHHNHHNNNNNNNDVEDAGAWAAAAEAAAAATSAAGDATTASTESFLGVAGLRADAAISGRPPAINREGNVYPITRAVRDWMVRTRESTPEVELLKSPRTILKEIGMDVDGGGEEQPKPVAEEVWSLTPASSFDDDLLECWEDIDVAVAGKMAAQETTDKPVLQQKEQQQQESMEASLEVYESLYGKSEDFQRIRAEIEERKRNGTLPKHGGLPYKAICCSLM